MIELEYINDTWVVMEDAFMYLSDKTSITIPKGFKTDLASVPRILWPLLPPFGKYNRAAIAHDFLYRNKMYNRRFCDYQLFFLSREDKTNIITSYILYIGVRLFGANYY